jgi:SAM-dependent methyltransferase
MAIDPNLVKEFWDSRAKEYHAVAFESVANLEQDPDNLKLKIELESEKVFDYLPDLAGRTVLDLGAGVGQWAFRFAERGARKISAVEYSAALAEIGTQEAALRGVDNVEFVVSPAEHFEATMPYDVVFISGLFVNMNDDQAELVAAHIPSFSNQDTDIVLRDGTAILERYELNKSFSDHLQTEYSAVYRTRKEYIDLFARNGMDIQRDENVFYDGCPLNKYPETRLRIYMFRRA